MTIKINIGGRGIKKHGIHIFAVNLSDRIWIVPAGAMLEEILGAIKCRPSGQGNLFKVRGKITGLDPSSCPHCERPRGPL